LNKNQIWLVVAGIESCLGLYNLRKDIMKTFIIISLALIAILLSMIGVLAYLHITSPSSGADAPPLETQTSAPIPTIEDIQRMVGMPEDLIDGEMGDITKEYWKRAINNQYASRSDYYYEVESD
jgi:hypothetical protein